ncbi:serine hydrolase FSH [Amylocystis lapponica]|nr:serine hydrolase FSH [Amylocystis lapponica]
MATKTPRRVLMLHGYAQSATIFSKRMGALRKACGKEIELVFIDAPHVLTPVDLAEQFSTSELGAEEASDQDPALTPRCWWKSDKALAQMNGLEDTLRLLRDLLHKDHYDGVFGFSQGACLAAILAALLEKPDTFPAFLIDGKPPHPPLQFCIAACGFRPDNPFCDSIFFPSYSTPTLHVLGNMDVIVVAERSNTLLEVSSNKRVEYHDGGHFIPSKANWRNFLRSYMRDPLGNVPSPGPAPVSQAPSGAATPVSSETPVSS